MDECDRHIVNALQGGFPLCERPFKACAEKLGLSEEELIARLERLIESGYLTRFGPMFNAEALGGALSLAAVRVPPERFEAIAARINAHPEVAHNYAREHPFNMWFVLASEDPGRLPALIAEIEQETGLTVIDLPKIEEFFVGFKVEA